MCGICGIYGLNTAHGLTPDTSIVRQMCAAMVHRGPDDEGIYGDEDISLGMRRLSIIDLATGHQPIFNEDRSIVIVFNGEIYNYAALRKEAERRGHRFYTHSDTESIVHLYEDFGPDCVHHLDGMFAFALWDTRKKRLFIARDRLGIKPVYYYEGKGGFLFASEIKALLASGLVERQVCAEAIYQYLSFYCIPAPLSIIEGVKSLPPGYRMTVSRKGIEVEQYWDVTFDEGPKEKYDERTLTKHLRERVESAVEKRLISDVPLGAFLSGGVDSSIIVGTMSRMMDQPVKTFSVGFRKGEERYDERSFAGLIARKFGTDHAEMIVGPEDVVRTLPKLLWYMDQPSGDAIQSFFVSEAARKKVTVSLSGLGGDELFGGYTSFKMFPLLYEMETAWDGPLGLLNPFALRPLAKLSGMLRSDSVRKILSQSIRGERSFGRKYEASRTLNDAREKRMLLSDRFLDEHPAFQESLTYIERYVRALPEGLDVTDKLSYLELKSYMPYMLLRDTDVMSMGNSLEVRVPLIDHRLVEFVASQVPPTLKVKGGLSKYLLIRSFEDILPDEVVHRRKMGFQLPMALWLRGPLKKVIVESLSSASIERRGLFRFEPLERAKQAFLKTPPRVSYLKVWAIAVLELWMRLVIDHPSNDIESVQTEDLLKMNNEQ